MEPEAAMTWIERRCVPAKTLKEPLVPHAIARALRDVHESWRLDEPGERIARTFRFGNYYETMSFANAVAWIAHTEDHHPQMEIAYRTCTVRYTTHAVDGITENDIICAAKIDALVSHK